MYDTTSRKVGIRVIRLTARAALAGVIRALGLVVLVLVLAPAAAAAAPEPGPWTAAPSSGPGARAVVRFAVDAGSGLLQPTVRYRLGRCSVSETVHLGLVARTGRRFLVVHRHRSAGRRAVVRLRLAGRFDSSFEAHGTLRGRIQLAGRPACRLPTLSWSAEAAAPPVPEEPLADDVVVEEELDIDDCEDCEEPVEDEER